MDINERYKKLKKEYNTLHEEKLRLEGQRKMYMEELNKLGCNSLEEAEEESIKLEKEIEELEKQINDELDKFENELEKVKNV